MWIIKKYSHDNCFYISSRKKDIKLFARDIGMFSNGKKIGGEWIYSKILIEYLKTLKMKENEVREVRIEKMGLVEGLRF